MFVYPGSRVKSGSFVLFLVEVFFFNLILQYFIDLELGFIYFVFFNIISVLFIVIKPGPARRVDLGPGKPGGWTGPGLIKDRLGQQPGRTRANPDETRFFFFKCGI
jgi:hypothetical protein